MSCVNTFTNVVFEDNRATREGGAIYYDSFRPIMTNLTFINNTAPYGNNIASYPVKAILSNGTSGSFSISDAPSGQEYDQVLTFSLVDFDNQVISSQTSGSMSIIPVTPGANALGFSSTSIVSGVSTFDGVIFQAQPGSNNIEYSVRTAAIDTAKIVKVFGTTSIQDPFYVSFRYCKPGESDHSGR